MKKFIHNKKNYFCELDVALLNDTDANMFYVELHYILEQGVNVSVEYYNQSGIRYVNVRILYTIHTLINTKGLILGEYLEADFMNKKKNALCIKIHLYNNNEYFLSLFIKIGIAIFGTEYYNVSQ